MEHERRSLRKPERKSLNNPVQPPHLFLQRCEPQKVKEAEDLFSKWYSECPEQGAVSTECEDGYLFLLCSNAVNGRACSGCSPVLGANRSIFLFHPRPLFWPVVLALTSFGWLLPVSLATQFYFGWFKKIYIYI
jgi:hypothetical protein